MSKDSRRIPWWLAIAIVLAAIFAAGLAAYFSWLAIPIVLGLIVLISLVILVFDNPWLGVALVAFFLPFERIGGFDVVGQTTLKISQVFALATIASWLLFYLIIKRRSYRTPAITWPLLAYLAIAALSLINAPNPTRGLAVFTFSAFAIIFALVIPRVICATKNVKRVVLALLLSAVIVSLFGIYQFAGDIVGLPSSLTGLREHYTQSVFGFPRVHSTGLEPLYFANYLLIPIAVAFMLWLQKSTWIKPTTRIRHWLGSRWFLLGTVLLGALALILTLSRGGYLGLIATGIIILVLGWRKIFSHRNIYIIVGVVLAVAIVSVLFINFSGRFSLDTFLEQATEYQKGASIEERYSTYDQASDLFAANPLFGIGIGNFGPAVATYYHRMPEGGWLIVNNESLELLAETGILGFAAIIGAIAILLWQSIRALYKSRLIEDENNKRFLQAVLGGLLAAFIGILVQYQTFSTIYILHVWFVIGLMIALIAIIRANVKPIISNKV